MAGFEVSTEDEVRNLCLVGRRPTPLAENSLARRLYELLG